MGHFSNTAATGRSDQSDDRSSHSKLVPDSSVRFRLPVAIKIRQMFAQVFDLRHIVDNDVGFVRMMGEVILMISFRFIKSIERGELSNDRPVKRFALVQ